MVLHTSSFSWSQLCHFLFCFFLLQVYYSQPWFLDLLVASSLVQSAPNSMWTLSLLILVSFSSFPFLSVVTIHFYMSLYVNLFSTSNICVSADRAKMKGLLCKYETCHYVPLEILENTWKSRGRNANTDSMVCKLSLPVVVAGGDIREEDKTLLSISSLTIKRLGLSNKLHPEVSLITLIKLKVDSELH